MMNEHYEEFYIGVHLFKETVISILHALTTVLLCVLSQIYDEITSQCTIKAMQIFH